MRLHPAVACAMVVVGGLMLMDQSFLQGPRTPTSELSIGLFAWSLRIIFGLSLILIAVAYSFIKPPPDTPQ